MKVDTKEKEKVNAEEVDKPVEKIYSYKQKKSKPVERG